MKKAIVILHGWGLTGDKYVQTAALLKKRGYEVYSPDLPGFGKEPLVRNDMDLSGYVGFLKDFLEKRKIDKVIFIGHSFGGRVALKFVYRYPGIVSKLILTGVPVIRHNTTKRYLAYVVSGITGRGLHLLPSFLQYFLRKSLYFMLGEWDYYNAGDKKQVFKNIIGEDLTTYAKAVTVPTLLVWGQNDRLTPASDVAKIKSYISDSKSVVIPGFGHKLPYEAPAQFIQALGKFL